MNEKQNHPLEDKHTQDEIIERLEANLKRAKEDPNFEYLFLQEPDEGDGRGVITIGHISVATMIKFLSTFIEQLPLDVKSEIMNRIMAHDIAQVDVGAILESLGAVAVELDLDDQRPLADVVQDSLEVPKNKLN